MLDYDLIKVFRPIIVQGLADLGYPNTDVLMNYQQTKQGMINNTVYFHVINDKNIGHLERVDYWDNDLGKMVTSETQAKETTFQVDTILKQSPDDIGITAKDLCTYVNLILQKRSTITTLQNNGIGILWINEIRNVPFTDEDDNYSYNPSFDFTISHSQSLGGNVPIIDTFQYNLKRV